ncbi:MAG: RNA pyrophosphohydrolase, partial [Bradyrhizobium sp.]|nr:RNA pyrophosphohydrolase [Bradyrhizobium sp.]
DPGEDAWEAAKRALYEETRVRSVEKLAEIDVERPGGGVHKAEFISWRWEPMQNLPTLIVPFKRPVYERVVKEFAALAGK